MTPNQHLVEIETEKAVAPVPSTAAGVVKKIHVKKGDTVSPGDVLVTLEEATAVRGVQLFGRGLLDGRLLVGRIRRTAAAFR